MNKILILLSTLLLPGCNQPKNTDLEQVFSNPPESTKPWCYWYWISDNISKEGITKDLEAMAEVGIGEAFIGNILDETVPRGNVKVLSKEWWSMVEYAIREADRLGIKAGIFNCPGWSQSGGLWVKPEQTTMRPELLVKLMQLVKDGATLIGPAPKSSPSMQNYPTCDEQVKIMAKKLWDNCDGIKQTEHAFGKGRVFCGIAMKEAFNRMKIVPDVSSPANYRWIHRQKGTTDIYFVTNQSNKKCNDTISFRVTGKQPELWDAVSGQYLDLPLFQEKDGQTLIPLKFSDADSWFIVFRKKVQRKSFKDEVNFPATIPVMELTGTWNLKFNSIFGAPADTTINKLFDWTTDKNTTVKYYSGAATYRMEFMFNPEENVNYLIELGVLESFATVSLNGQKLGILWRQPYQTDITNALKNGTNVLEVEVVNTWWNRLVGDAQPNVIPYTWAATRVSWNASSELIPSGLLGPVKILTK